MPVADTGAAVMPRAGDTIGGWVVEDVVRVAGPAAFRATRGDEVAWLEIEPRTPATELAVRRSAEALRVLDDPAIPRLLDHGTDLERPRLARHRLVRR